MNCLCDDENCKIMQNFEGILNDRKIIYTLKTEMMTVNDLIHIFMTGIRMINVDLLYGVNEDQMKKINEAIQKFEDDFEFNAPISKLCTIKGRISRIGRMRNDYCWQIKYGDLIVLTCDEIYKYCSTNEVCFVTNFKRIIPLLQICDSIQIESIDENINLQVVKIIGDYVTCNILKSGKIESNQKLLFHQFDELYHELIDEEIQDCNFAKAHKFNFIIVPDVRHPRYYHKLQKEVKESEIKLMAKIERELSLQTIEKIGKHFCGIFIATNSNVQCVINSLLSYNKPVVVKFPKGKCLTRTALEIFEKADGFEVNCGNLNELIKSMKKLNNISKNIGKYSSLNKQVGFASNEDKKLEGDKTNYTYTMMEESKVIVCLTHSGKAIREIVAAGYGCEKFRYIIALTRDKKLAERLNILRSILPIFYVNCDGKNEEDQEDEMMAIALKFCKSMKIISTEDPIVEKINKIKL